MQQKSICNLPYFMNAMGVIISFKYLANIASIHSKKRFSTQGTTSCKHSWKEQPAIQCLLCNSPWLRSCSRGRNFNCRRNEQLVSNPQLHVERSSHESRTSWLLCSFSC